MSHPSLIERIRKINRTMAKIGDEKAPELVDWLSSTEEESEDEN